MSVKKMSVTKVAVKLSCLLLGLIISVVCAAADYQQLLQLAEQGDATAQFDLGTLYDVGDGVEQDYVQAATWYRKSAEQGESAALYNLAIMYDAGEGVRQDVVQAYAWMSAAEIFGNKGTRESSKDFLSRMTPMQIQQGDNLVTEIVQRITSRNE